MYDVVDGFFTSRRTLPCQTDDELMSNPRFNRPPESDIPPGVTIKGGKGKVGDKPASPKKKKEDSVDSGTLPWMIAPAPSPRSSISTAVRTPTAEESKEIRMTSLDPKYLDHEQTALDLVLVSKVLLCIQVASKHVDFFSLFAVDLITFCCFFL